MNAIADRHEHNKRVIMQLSSRSEGVTTSELSAALGVSRSRSLQLLEREVYAGEIEKTDKKRKVPGRGRPAWVYQRI